MRITIQRVSITLAISMAAGAPCALAGFINTTSAGEKQLFINHYPQQFITVKAPNLSFNVHYKRPATNAYANQVNRWVFAQDNSQSNDIIGDALPNDLSMTSIPTPGTVALIALAGLVNSRRRQM